jgi:hypothetical protein
MDARAAKPGVASPGSPDSSTQPAEEAPPNKTPDPQQPVERREPSFAFRQIGETWKVVFEGAPAFHVEDSLGAKYLDYLLHHPGEAISAYDLEMAIRPERAQVRPRNSIQGQQDSAAVREYLRELERVRGLLETAREVGNQLEQNQLEADLESLEAQLEGRTCAADAADRARNNVRKAVCGLTHRLQKGDRVQRGFAAYIRTCICLGYRCIHNQPTNQDWA